MFVYTIQPVVKLVVQPDLTTGWTNSGCSFNTVVKPVGCLFTRYSWLSIRLYNRFHNRLYRVNGVFVMSTQFGYELKSTDFKSAQNQRSRTTPTGVLVNFPNFQYDHECSESSQQVLGQPTGHRNHVRIASRNKSRCFLGEGRNFHFTSRRRSPLTWADQNHHLIGVQASYQNRIRFL